MMVKVLARNRIIPLYKSLGYLQVFRIYLFDFHKSNQFFPKMRSAHMPLQMLPCHRL